MVPKRSQALNSVPCFVALGRVIYPPFLDQTFLVNQVRKKKYLLTVLTLVAEKGLSRMGR